MTTLRAGHATNVGQIRSNNEDSFLMVREHELYGVADGMGGHQGGEVASALAVRLAEENATEPNLEILEDAVRLANRTIFEQAGGDPGLHGMGTTFVAVQLVDTPEEEVPVIGWVNVGDSRLYLFRDDEVVQLSHDHSLVEDLVRDGRLSPEEAAVHPQRNILTRALGIDIDVKVDSGTVLPFTGDRFLLCSDGLSNEVTNEQMAAVLRRLADPDEAAAELVRQANEHGGRDNITVVVVDVVDDGGRAQIASAILAEQAAAKAAEASADDTTSLPIAQDGGLYDDDPPAFADRRSSLPDADDDYATEIDDPYSSLNKLRTRRITWGVIGFFVLLALIGAAVVGAVGWSAKNTYYVTFDDAGQVVIYQGKPGGVLFFDPKLAETTTVQRDDLPAKYQQDVAAEKEFGSKADARRYAANLRTIISDRDAEQATTTTTAPASTTTTAPAGSATTSAPATTTPGP